MGIELKSCPFCGNPDVDLYCDQNKRTGIQFLFVKCQECGATGGTCADYDWKGAEDIFESRAAVIAARKWNRRDRNG